MPDSGGGHYKSYIVDTGYYSASIGGLASGTWVNSKPNGEEEVVVDCQWDIGRVLFGVQASEGVCEGVGNLGCVLGRGVCAGCEGCGQCTGVVHGGSGGLVIDCDWSIHEW
ncbi:unnamed protein product [Citrullus colocynthis]|uniref:Uncharacterized protein n=1 Tax=Citrullus colocynthis TaxID=252529 RepID=A0ABP0YX60_9ROSI